jgi:NADH-quinone oxidoreductase subunit N
MTQEMLESLESGLLRDLTNFQPELILCGTIIVLLLLRLFSMFNRWHLGAIALLGTVFALFNSGLQWVNERGLMLREEMFTGLLIYDHFTIYLRLFLFSFTALTIWLCLLTGIPDREDSADFNCLLLGAVVGMSLMASSNHLLMVFIGVEMASLPSYALAGFLKGRRQSSEASLKYVVYGGGASGVMLYGISLLAGKYGTAYLPEVAAGLLAAPVDVFAILGVLFVLIGIGFKVAAVPFHFWCPDVFEGASAEVAGFLSVASKGAALALLARIALALAGLSGALGRLPVPSERAWMQAAEYLVPALAFFAALTATFGNLAAYGQTNLKRMLAYSTIAHAGYMMMGLAALNRQGVGAVLFYLVAYLFMNLGAFAVVAFLRNQTGSEDLSSFRGLIQRSPLLVITLAVFLLSLLGIPPLVGFVAKFQIFSVLFESGNEFGNPQGPVYAPNLSYLMYGLLVIGGLNTVLSLFYYIKVLRVMILDKPLEEVESRPSEPLPLSGGAAVFASVMAVMILVLFIAWEPLYDASQTTGVSDFRSAPTDVRRTQGGAVAPVQEVRR